MKTTAEEPTTEQLETSIDELQIATEEPLMDQNAMHTIEDIQQYIANELRCTD